MKDKHLTKVEEQFGSVAREYLSSSVHSQGPELLDVVRAVRSRPPGAVLDLGCGAGHLTFTVAGISETVIAYDLSGEMLETVGDEAARRGFQNIRTVKGSAENLPFPEEAFDWVCTRYSAHHWTDVRRALREARRVLRQDGGLIVIDVCAPESRLMDTHLQTIELLRDPSHVRDYSLKEWLSILNDEKFEVIQHSNWRLGLEFASWVRRMRTPESYVETIRSLLRNAPREVLDHFEVQTDGSFQVDAAIFQARSVRLSGL